MSLPEKCTGDGMPGDEWAKNITKPYKKSDKQYQVERQFPHMYSVEFQTPLIGFTHKYILVGKTIVAD